MYSKKDSYCFFLFFLLVMTGRNMKAKIEPFCYGQHMLWWASKLSLPPSPWFLSLEAYTFAFPFGSSKLKCIVQRTTVLAPEHVCRKEMIGNVIRRAQARSVPRLFAPQGIGRNKNSNQSHISSRKDTYKTWMQHQHFGLAISTSKELAAPSYRHPDGTFILLATLFLMGLKRKPTQAVWLPFRTCFHLEAASAALKNGPKWRRMGKAVQCTDSVANSPHSLAAPSF